MSYNLPTGRIPALKGKKIYCRLWNATLNVEGCKDCFERKSQNMLEKCNGSHAICIQENAN